MGIHSYYEYFEFDNEKFFTLILKPAKIGKFPVIITRSPYVSGFKDKSEEELLKQFTENNKIWAENGYAFVFQHCRGQGKSTGEFVPYVHEREDGLFLREKIREQSFYNGEIYLLGASYTASLHYATAPFEKDIKAAVFDVQDCERYRLWYRNGQMRRGHANWHFSLYKDKCNLKKTHSNASFSELPLTNLSQRVLGDRACDFEEMLISERFENPFWNTRNGGNDARSALKNAGFPILLTTGYNDYYIGGMFKMWEEMSPETKEKCAMIVSPYNHGDSFYGESGIKFECASIRGKFGNHYHLNWFNAVKNKEKPFVKTGVVTYYRTFEDKWETDFYKGNITKIKVPFGTGEKTFEYNPENPPSFNPEGTWMKDQSGNKDVITFYTKPMEKDVFIKGNMKLNLTVKSDCEDTAFFVMTGIHKKEGDYALRQDITSLCYQKGDYAKNEKVTLEFVFEEYAFLLKKGECLRLDIASADNNSYVCHTNIKGQYSMVETTKIAKNTVFPDESHLVLPIEKAELRK